MNDFKNIRDLCLRFMQKDIICNIDDLYLFCTVTEYITKREGTYNDDVAKALDVLKHHYQYKIPNYKSIIRTRSALHREYPNLRVCSVYELRKRQEELFYNYFKEF